jgi:hypothetical protein
VGNFVDDMAPRRGLFSSEKKKEVDLRPVILFTDVDFFAERDKDGKPKGRWSAKVWDQVVEKFLNGEHRLIICVDDELGKWAKGNFVAEHHDDLTVFTIKPGSATENTLRLQITLQSLGLKMKTIRNKRTVSFLNIHKYVVGGLSYYAADDYEKAGVAIDKELTFSDMVSQRKSSAWP